MTATHDRSAPVPASGRAVGSDRLDSVDLLRGAIMIVMSLDHVRDYFTYFPFAPEDITRTWPALFFTRWITHFCAPLFFLLAGVGAALSARRIARGELSQGLWTRGLWLVLLELTVVGFAWTFYPGWSFGGVIWALGWSMVGLSVIVRLPLRWVAAFALSTIVLHNLLDPIRPEMLGTWAGPVWGLLHAPGFIPIAPELNMWGAPYVLVPWIGVMAAGFALGEIYKWDGARRRRLLLALGIASIALFVVLRATNVYGNPVPPLTLVSPGDFTPQSTLAASVMLFLDVEKYPPSLQFLLMTLGPGLIALALLEGVNMRARSAASSAMSAVLVIGRVPLFYYVLHLFVIHLITMPVAFVLGQPWDARLWGGHVFTPPPPGYGLNLTGIYVVWLIVNVLLYLPCRAYAEYKRTHRHWWLKYL